VSDCLQPRPLVEADIESAGAVLHRAFADDPGLLFVIPDANERDRLCPDLARQVIRYALRYGSPLVIGEPIQALALCFGSEDPEADMDGLATLGLTDVPVRIGREGWNRFQQLLVALDKPHVDNVPEPHWYLAMIGTDHFAQGMGLGRALMKAVLERAQRDGVACYLETPNAHNVSFYEHRGFQVVGETDIPGSTVHIWMMRRDPAS
jgi:ribosomal protein S18 acetylase RimI-like enzyme